MPDHTILAASDSARLIMFAAIMVVLLGNVGLATYFDERAARQKRVRFTDDQNR
jgi:hypothetical protein